MKQAITMFLWLMLAIVSSAQEVTLFDSDGEARAYIDANNNEMPIYLWSGEPVAYLKSSKKSGYCIMVLMASIWDGLRMVW